MPMALDDLFVLDLSHALAGPFASTWLADNGARVVKVEPPSGDIARVWGPPFHGEDSAYFVTLQRNKKSVVLDLKHPEGKEIFFRLAERADVLVENFRVGTVAKLGIDFPRVQARNPRLVYCSISGFGQDGPYRDRAAMDLIVQAESGLLSVTGEPGSHGVRCGVSIADLTAGMNAAFAILAALHARGRTGRGQYLDVSMLEGQLGLLDTMIGGYLADGIVPGPMGTAYKALLPYQTFRTRTRDIAIAVGSDSLWRIFCPLLGLEGMRDDPRYATNAARSANRSSLIARLQEAFLTRTYEEWEAILLPAGIPMGAINTLDRAALHPQVVARKSLASCQHPVAGEVTAVAPGFRMSETPGGLRMPAPLLGQHTAEVLRDELDLPEAEITRLEKAGAIAIRGSS
jgi:crotonobetainyl-CoA:carnitine CoA-transferase CaiB-like acyl-CoA transferase